MFYYHWAVMCKDLSCTNENNRMSEWRANMNREHSHERTPKVLPFVCDWRATFIMFTHELRGWMDGTFKVFLLPTKTRRPSFKFTREWAGIFKNITGCIWIKFYMIERRTRIRSIIGLPQTVKQFVNLLYEYCVYFTIFFSRDALILNCRHSSGQITFKYFINKDGYGMVFKSIYFLKRK